MMLKPAKLIFIIILLSLLTFTTVSATDNATNNTFSMSDSSVNVENNAVSANNFDNVSVNAENNNESISSEKEDLAESAAFQSSSEISKTESATNEKHAGYWALSLNMYDLDLDDLSNKGVTDVLLNFFSYERYGKDNLESWISNANAKGIHVHIWTQIFWTSKTGWVRPIVNGSPNTEFFNNKTEELIKYASLKGVSGIHMDYLRFSGSEKNNNAAWQNPKGKETISGFVKNITDTIRQINPNLTISAAIMPEMNNLERVYGVDYSLISRYLDVIIPMVYAGNYHKDRDWIKSTTKTFVDNSKGAKIWTGLQSYDNDNDLNHLSIGQMNGDINAALSGGACGAIIFRIGVCENIDFKNALNLKININARDTLLILPYAKTYCITLKDSKGNAIPNEKVKFVLNGKTLTSITNSRGIAKITLTSKLVKIGRNMLVIKLSDGKTKTVKITAKKSIPKLIISRYKKMIKITLKNSKNKPIKAKIIIKINRKTYQRYTNSKGILKFKMNKKSKIFVKYNGGKYYRSITKKA